MSPFENKSLADYSVAEASEIIQAWKKLSEMESIATQEAAYEEINPLLSAVMEDIHHPLAKFAAHWLGENLAAEGRYDEATEAQQFILDHYPEKELEGRAWPAIALHSMAEYALNAGNQQLAIERYRQLVLEYPEDPGRLDAVMRLGELQEYAGYHLEAIETYESLLPLEDARDRALVDLRLETLRTGAPWAEADLGSLVQAVREALESRDATALIARMTGGTFYLAPGCGCMAAEATTTVAEYLQADLPTTERLEIAAELEQHEGHRKAYLKTEGWNGTFFRGVQHLQFRYGPEGWVFGGMVGEFQPGSALHQTYLPAEFPPEEEEIGRSSHGLTASKLKIKAPWLAGKGFRAGGVGSSVWHLITIAIGIWPFRLIPLFFAKKFSNTPCGYGLLGFYYGGWGHRDREHFAVDFVRYKRGVPYLRDVAGSRVLAVAEGLVSWRVNKFPNGASSNNEANLVHVTHWDLKEGEGGSALAVALLAEIFGNKGAVQQIRKAVKFRSHYVHLEGGPTNPRRSQVKVGQYVPQGKVLGFMDDTGTSAFDHLHFAFYDLNTGRSVILDDLDGQVLGPHDDGKCITSTNKARP